jgi:hypothetical protein
MIQKSTTSFHQLFNERPLNQVKSKTLAKLLFMFYAKTVGTFTYLQKLTRAAKWDCYAHE